MGHRLVATTTDTVRAPSYVAQAHSVSHKPPGLSATEWRLHMVVGRVMPLAGWLSAHLPLLLGAFNSPSPRHITHWHSYINDPVNPLLSPCLTCQESSNPTSG